MLRVVKEKMGNFIHCVPETATIMITLVGLNPKLNARRFNSSLYRVQAIFEATSAEQAVDEKKKAMLLDRGTIDNAAYMKGLLTDFSALIKTTADYEYSKYQLVICLEMPPKHVYEQHRYNNPARKESYEEAFLLGEKIKEVWKGHPNLHLVSGENTWEEKEKTVLYIIRKFLDGK